jgi:4-hydroxy-tetrahydrodipicolinate synthase
MVRFALKGDFQKAREMHYRLFGLMRANFLESNPVPLKSALTMMGKIEETLRLPLVKISNTNRAKMKSVLKSMKLI